jgi:hypothetical protein
MERDNRALQVALVVAIIFGSLLAGGSVFVRFDEIGQGLRISRAVFTDTNENNKTDTLELIIQNNGFLRVKIDNITIQLGNMNIDWQHNESIAITSGENYRIICTAKNSSMEIGFLEVLRVYVHYNQRYDFFIVKIGIEFSNTTFIFSENFESDFEIDQWDYFRFETTNGKPIHGGLSSLLDWIVYRDYQEYDNSWYCSTSNCQYTVLRTDLYDFGNVNFSADLRCWDNDGTGIIFRYNDSGLYPKFYLVWHTYDHPINDEEYIEDEAHLYNWTTPDDVVELGRINLHYVEGYDAGNSTIGFRWTKLNSTASFRNQNWQNWMISLKNNDFKLYYNYEETLSYSGLTLTDGTFGFASFESRFSSVDNIYIW